MRGATLHLYPDTGQWRIYWASERTGVLDPPMIGGLRDGRGESFAQESHEGRAVYSRFRHMLPFAPRPGRILAAAAISTRP